MATTHSDKFWDVPFNAGTTILDTRGKFLDRDIHIAGPAKYTPSNNFEPGTSVNPVIGPGYLDTMYHPVSGSVSINDKTLSVSVPAANITANAEAVNQNGVTLGNVATSAPSGVSIKVTGGNSAITAAVAGESATVTKTEGWISGGAETIYSNATIAAKSKTVYYPITKITVPSGSSFDIEGPGRTNFKSASSTTGNLYVNAYNSATTPALIGAIQVVNNGKLITSSATKVGGTVSWGTGWIEAGSETIDMSDLGISSGDFESHSVWTPNSTYFTTTSGDGVSNAKYPKNTYNSNDWYVKKGSVSINDIALTISVADTDIPVDAKAVNQSGVTLGNVSDTVPTGVSIKVSGSVSANTKSGESATVTKNAGWIDGGTSTITSSVSIAASSKTVYFPITAITVPAGSSFSIGGAGRTDFTSGSATTGNLYVNAYNSASTPALTGAKQVVNNGKWVATSLTATSTSGTYYGMVTFTKPSALTVTTSYSNAGMSTYFDEGTSTNKDVTITPKYTNTVGYKAALITATNNGGEGYWKIKTTSATKDGGTVSWGTGWIEAGSETITQADLGISSGDFESHSVWTPSSTYFTTTSAEGISAAKYPKDTYNSSDWYVKKGSATTPTNSTALTSSSTSLSSTTLTVQASVTPTVTAGWVSSGTAGTVKISGTVPTETKTATGSGDVTPSTNKLLTKVTVPAAGGTFTMTGSTVTDAVEVGTLASGYYPINAKVKGAVTAGTAGWFSNSVAIQAGTATQVGKIAAAVAKATCTDATASVSVAPGTVSIAANTTAATGATRLAISPTTTAPSSNYYIAVKATAAANTTGTTGSITGTNAISCTTAGYMPTSYTGASNAISGTAKATTSAKDSSVYYLPIPTAAIETSMTDVSGGGVIVAASGNGIKVNDTNSHSGCFINYDITQKKNIAATVTTAGYTPTGTFGSQQVEVSYSDSIELNGVTINAPSSGENVFYITVPNGTGTIAYYFHVKADGSTYITESAAAV